jgi:N-acetyl-anhydromuramyl-L-alanine amidase AmpD
MTKQAEQNNRHRIWVFSQTYDFHIVTTDISHAATGLPLTAEDYRHPPGDNTPSRRQKHQIVLHCTGANNPGENSIRWWNRPASGRASAHYVVERTTSPQTGRPPLPGGTPPADNQDTNLVDVVRVMEDETITFHGGRVNSCSIGIEHANAATGWRNVNAGGRINEPSMVGGHARPRDLNRYIRLRRTHINGDFQAYEEKQYMAMILLLRHLCMEHRIPRLFLGLTTEEVFRPWCWRRIGTPELRRYYRNHVLRFRGILHHRNTHDPSPTASNPNPRPKACPGIIHRNRLYRGITDEWWLPVALDGQPRTYYSGPFAPHDWEDGEETRNAFFRLGSARQLEGVVYRNADLDALMETRPHFDLDQVNQYYARAETRRGGLFPVGVNMSWHGGIHLPVRDTSPCVFAAASGTIVAARLSSHRDTVAHIKFGSQRFVLVRHAVYPYTEADPDGVGRRIDYSERPANRDRNTNPTNPVYVFTLYMHLLPVPQPDREDDRNPPWFNLWRRNNPRADIGMDGDKGRVIAPNINVSVGDILGMAGRFRDRRMIHFEVLTHRQTELTVAPWNDPIKRVVDTDSDAICDVNTLNRFITDVSGDGIDTVDVLRAAPQLREVKALHKSEWSLTSESQIRTLIPHDERRRALWPHIRRFSWVAEAVRVNPGLRRQLGDQNGMFWHYHPITFMAYINRLIRGEHREIEEREHTRTNVEIDEDGYFSRFIDWHAAHSRFVAAGADNDRLEPNDVSSGAYRFRARRLDIACRQAAPHHRAGTSTPDQNPPQTTRFSAALLETLESIRAHYHRTRRIEISLGYVCGAHRRDPSICVMNSSDAIQKHEQGVAVDFRPVRANRNSRNCTRLWNSTRAVVDSFNQAIRPEHVSGNPTQSGMPTGYDQFRYQTHPATVQAKLEASPQQALDGNAANPASEVGGFRIHLELVDAGTAAPRASTTPLPVRLRITCRSISVLNDRDIGSAEWSLRFTVNGQTCGTLRRSGINTGNVISLSGWTRTLTLDPEAGDTLRISVTGREEDLVWHDRLGSVDLRYQARSEPGWGIGSRTERSSNGSFDLILTIESLNVEY